MMIPIPGLVRHVLQPVLLLLPLAVCLPAGAADTPRTYRDLPSETPEKFEVPVAGFDYERRVEMIPMRDGVKLHTVILLPRGARRAPILLTRTPYNADELTTHSTSSHLGPALQGYDNATDVILAGGYIRAVQDVRGKYGSEGDYVMNRPLHGPQNPTPVDHSTDTYDTIEWLVTHLPESNGRVGILGISYDGFLPLMALVHPHPALKAAVPMNPMVDGWMGDDWFHKGAFRQINLEYILEQEASRKNEIKWVNSDYDEYDTFLRAGLAGALARERGMDQLGFWRKLVAHPEYDDFWQQQAVDRLLASEAITVPTLLVHSLWDQEDIYGALAVYAALKSREGAAGLVHLAMGPWYHGQSIEDGSALGALHFGTDTALEFRRDVLRPFLDRHLKDASDAPDIARVTAYETGSNVWRRLPDWPAGCASGCRLETTALHLRAGHRASFAAPATGDEAFDEYVSDPAKPVPYRARPIRPTYSNGSTWSQWLVDDQREASGRTDVLVYTSEVLEAPLKISGQPIADLVASTSGTDSDWVVKLIDVYPAEVAADPAMGGYQLMVSADILRGRYRERFDHAAAIPSDTALHYRFSLPAANHVFLPGHRVMVQIQSSWFPLYDRNPQTFVPSIFWAQAADYRKATQRIYHAPGQASVIELPVVRSP